jgi:3-hydroxybutyryl-CoA dehydrogenase
MSLKVVIVGSGLMGRGIGLAFAIAGHRVTLVDIDDDVLTQAVANVTKELGYLSDQKVLEEPPAAVLSRITTSKDKKKAMSAAGFVVEAVFENLDAKKEVFRELDAVAPRSCILASNTSSLPISAIAGVANHPERILGAHFWNPPYLMSSVEVVRGEKTSDETVTRTVEILRGIGKSPAVLQKDVPGQIGIRILYAMIREATALVENGVASVEDVDTIVKEAIGSRLEVLGPFELADLSGVDLVNNVAKGLYKTLDASKAPQKLVQDMVARGEVGIKSGKGFYDWKGGQRNVEAILKLRDEHLIRMLKKRKEKGREKVTDR